MAAIEWPRDHAFIGVDLGQRRDPAAVVVLERRAVLTGEFDYVTWQAKRELRYMVRHAERMALATPYLTVAARVARLAKECEGRRTVVVDASGVGAPVVEMIRWAATDTAVVPVTITAGGDSRPDRLNGGYTVSRRDLLSALRVVVESGRLTVARSAYEGKALNEELKRVGAHSGREHDDLAVAMALAVWQARRGMTGLTVGKALEGADGPGLS